MTTPETPEFPQTPEQPNFNTQPVPPVAPGESTAPAQPVAPVPPVAPAQPVAGQPGAPVPPAGAQPGYGQPVYGQPVAGQPVYGQPVVGQPVPAQPAPGQPGYGQPAAAPAAPAGPSFGDQLGAAVNNLDLGNYLTAMKHIWKGETAQGIDLVDKIKNFWLVATGALVFFSAFVNTFFLGRISGQPGMGFLRFTGGSGSLADLLDTRASYMGFSFGQFMGAFVKYILLLLVIYCVRAAVMVLTAKLRKTNFSFTRALGLVAFAYIPSLLILAVVFVLSLLPTAALLRLCVLILFVAIIPAILFAELLMYIGFNRHNRVQKSVLVPYVVLTGAGFLVAGLVMALLTAIFRI